MAKINDPGFQLGDQLTDEQLAFFDKNGFIIFRNFLTPQRVELYLSEAVRIEKEWLADNRDKVNGVPLKFGMDDKGERLIQRLCFLSLYSKPLHALLNDPRLQQLVQFLSPYEGRIAEDEKDGLVLNHYVNCPESSFTQMGWHTDSPRDIFLGQKIMPMLNVGIHLNDCPYENGGLRLLPGTHKQGIFGLLFRKKYFIDNNEDPDEVGMDINAGDLTVHDGRLWHRAQSSPFYGEKSRRRVMYVPVITGKYMPKSEKSKTPLYHRIASWVLD